MGDHRASIKIEFSMHGHEAKTDMWVNYHPADDCVPHKVDRRVLEWLTTAYEEAMNRWFDAEFDQKEMDRAKAENAEREELARLKQKYEGNE